MITKERLVKVMDFGIAKMASSSKTQTDVVSERRLHMFRSRSRKKVMAGRMSSLLGVVLELLTGHPPFTADNLSALPSRLPTIHPDLHTPA
jgi:serine/threonine-protein kinase